jgi:hypothetical protein
MQNGAQPSDSMQQVFKVSGTLDRFERFKEGESVDVLLKEAEDAEAERGASNTTSN